MRKLGKRLRLGPPRKRVTNRQRIYARIEDEALELKIKRRGDVGILDG